jgi:mRNA interferase RelE/StbE
MRLEPTRRFARDYDHLPTRIQQATDARLALLTQAPRHPSLRLKRVQGSEEFWEISVNMQYRVIVEFVSDELTVLHRVGTHAILKWP